MAETDFILLWKKQYDQLDQSLQINQKILKEMISQKVSKTMRSLTQFKIIGVVITLLYLCLLGTLISFAIKHYTPAANYFLVSMTAIFFITLKGLFDYLQHLVWIAGIDYDDTITVIQEKLLQVQFSLFSHNRIMFLQIPFWTTFYLSNQWFPQSAGTVFIIFQFLFTASACLLAGWLYRNFTVANAHKKWVKVFMRGAGGKNIQAALGFYKEIEQFKLN